MFGMSFSIQNHLPGSFPDIDDFDSTPEYVAAGFSGMVFKTSLNGSPVVLKVSIVHWGDIMDFESNLLCRV